MDGGKGGRLGCIVPAFFLVVYRSAQEGLDFVDDDFLVGRGTDAAAAECLAGRGVAFDIEGGEVSQRVGFRFCVEGEPCVEGVGAGSVRVLAGFDLLCVDEEKVLGVIQAGGPEVFREGLREPGLEDEEGVAGRVDVPVRHGCYRHAAGDGVAKRDFAPCCFAEGGLLHAREGRYAAREIVPLLVQCLPA